MVGAVLQAQLNWSCNASGFKSGLCLSNIGSAFAITIKLLEGLNSTGKSLGNVRVQGRVGALVNLLRDGFAVNEVSYGLTNCQCLCFVGISRGCTVRL